MGSVKHKILVVDDIEINREILMALLEDKYEILQAENGKVALSIIQREFKSLSIILLDLMMPEMDGFAVLEELNKKQSFHIPVIVITANNELDKEKRALQLGAVDFIQKPFDPDIVHYRVDTHIKLKAHQDHLESLVEESVNKMSEVWTTVILTLADIIEYRNQESGLHVKRASLMTNFILKLLNERDLYGYQTSPKIMRYITEIAGLHDIGKIGVPDAVLTKPGKLTDEEFTIMKTHAVIGDQMSESVTRNSDDNYKRICHEITRHHHERWDGRGYPDGLKGDAIPLSARIVAIADTYDAMTNDRCYRKGMPHEKAIELIRAEAGKQFDPVIVDLFCANADLIYKMNKELSENTAI